MNSAAAISIRIRNSQLPRCQSVSREPAVTMARAATDDRDDERSIQIDARAASASGQDHPTRIGTPPERVSAASACTTTPGRTPWRGVA